MKASTRGCAAKASEAVSLPVLWSGPSSTAGSTSRMRRGKLTPGRLAQNRSGSRVSSARKEGFEVPGVRCSSLDSPLGSFNRGVPDDFFLSSASLTTLAYYCGHVYRQTKRGAPMAQGAASNDKRREYREERPALGQTDVHA